MNRITISICRDLLRAGQVPDASSSLKLTYWWWKTTVTVKASNEISESTNQSSFRFSIRAVFLLSTAVCVGFTTFPFLHLVRPGIFFSGYILVSGLAFGLSGRAGLGCYLLHFLGALFISDYLAIICFAQSPSWEVPTNSRLVFNSILTGTGLWWSFIAIRHGHWSTKLITTVPLFLILASAISAIFFAIRHPELIFAYWLNWDIAQPFVCVSPWSLPD